MKRVCIDARMILSSGIGTYLRNVIARLKGFDLQLIVHPGCPKWLSKFDLLYTKAPIYSLREQVELARLVRDVDLFWSPHFNVPLLPIRAKKRLVTIHDVYHLAHPEDFSWVERRVARFLIGRAVSDRVITVSHFSKREIERLTGAKEVEVIYPGVDRSVFCKGVKRLGMQKPFLFFIGNMKKHKNVSALVAAHKKVRDEFDLVIVGKKSDLRRVVNVEQGNGVHCFEGVEESALPSFYRSAFATVIPSYYEGFGLPAIEAMACGCPVIASNRASLPEVCGEDAVYINPDKPEEIVQAIRRIKKPSGELGYCWDQCAREHEKVMEELCELR